MENRKKFDHIAQLAVERYDVPLKSTSYLTEETNVFYKWVDVENNVYALKIYQEESSTLEDNQAELFYMDIVVKKNSVVIPSVVRGKDGKFVQLISSEHFAFPKRVVLFTWLEGEDLDGHENEARFIQLGEKMAHLHEATLGVKIPDHVHPRKWDKVLYFKGEQAVYKEKQYQRFLTEEYHQLMDQIIPFLDQELAKFYVHHSNDIQFIHADLNPWNVRVDGDEMSILDFEDCMLALPVHEFACVLYYYNYDENFDIEKVKEQLYQGYEKVRTLPHFTDYDLDVLMTARRVNYLNYVLQVDDDPVPFINKSLPIVRDFLRKYGIILND
ncbi:phosphotransferase enzyme family protein [Longirhabdus pacifica]|uniref:phosphotransferase enzyme family protein n=1 Tax=Longirhabdus pacifica TaxID=2305227 RepID=UPI001008F1DB|nr:phosphotransferase [Longirhabdus pacifica]